MATDRPDTMIQDQGVSSFLMGTEYLLRYVRWLVSKGFDQCDKFFNFGGDVEGHTRWMISILVLLECARPNPGLYDFWCHSHVAWKANFREASGRGRLWWQQIDRGKQGAMLLSLCQHLQEAEQLDNPCLDLRSEDAHERLIPFELKDLNAEERYKEMKMEIEGLANEETELERKEGIEKSMESLERLFVCSELQFRELRKKKLVWEIYAGKRRVSEECAKRGAEVMRFGLDNGWDFFSRAKHRRALLDLQYELEPDEIFLSPKCALWSPVQNINIRIEEDVRELQEK